MIGRVLLLLLPALALAHEGDRVLQILELSDADVALIDVHDGSIDDWFAVLGDPQLTERDFVTYQGKLPIVDEPTLQFRMWLAWHGASSRILVAVQTIDDVFVNDEPPDPSDPSWSFHMQEYDTFVGIGVDGDHSGGYGYYAGVPIEASLFHRETQEYIALGVLKLITLPEFSTSVQPFARYPPYSDAGGTVFSEQPFVTVTEAYVTAFDDMEWTAPEESQPSELRAGRIIGLALKVADADIPPTQRLANMYLLPGTWGVTKDLVNNGLERYLARATRFADALLLPAGDAEGAGTDRVLVDSWARIKASFAHEPPATSGKR